MMEYEEWAQEAAPRLVRFAYVLCGDRELAEDLAQDVLADAFVKWHRIQQVDHVDAYLKRSMINRRVSWWRRWGAREVAHADLPTHAVHMQSQDLDLWRACLALPERQRAAVVLRFYEGMDHAEIAAILRVGESSARSLVARGVAQLRTTMKQAEGKVR